MGKIGTEDQGDPERCRSVLATTPDTPTPILVATSADAPAPDPDPDYDALIPFDERDHDDVEPRRYRHPRLAILAALVIVAIVVIATLFITTGRAHSTTPPPRSVVRPTLDTQSLSGTTPSTTPPVSYSSSQIARLVDPAIVDIKTTTQTLKGYAYTAATGMLVTATGYIVTNNHVVENATKITVILAGGHVAPLTATFIGCDAALDIAVIKISGVSGLPTVHFGSSATLQLGQRVIAIGNALGRDGTPTMTSGEIVAFNRKVAANDGLLPEPESLSGMMQATASIQPGNSGGPLLDQDGQVIGLNTADNDGDLDAFAIPIDRVLPVVSFIEARRRVNGITIGLKAFLGLAVETTQSGVYVTRIIYGDPAANDGVEPGDYINSFNGTNVTTASQLGSLVEHQRIGTQAPLTYTIPAGEVAYTAVTRDVLITLVASPAP